MKMASFVLAAMSSDGMVNVNQLAPPLIACRQTKFLNCISWWNSSYSSTVARASGFCAGASGYPYCKSCASGYLAVEYTSMIINRFCV